MTTSNWGGQARSYGTASTLETAFTGLFLRSFNSRDDGIKTIQQHDISDSLSLAHRPATPPLLALLRAWLTLARMISSTEQAQLEYLRFKPSDASKKQY